MKFGYARVNNDKQNSDLQIDALNVYGVDEIYEENVTGPQQKRQQLTELLGSLRAGDTLVIGRLDRLGRTVKQFFALLKDFEQKGIRLVSIQDKFDTSTPTGKAVYGVFCSLAQMELDVLSERTKANMMAAKGRGHHIGRKPKENENVESALKMYFSGESTINDIVETTGVSRTTIYKYVRLYKSNNVKRN
ncbi:MAG TPA: resolvase [Desulfosporosinus sp.]|jgi:DNA invertase Pin-like site-specific DNA recombinase|nr:resolvase [Desulfosporosinus sp.]